MNTTFKRIGPVVAMLVLTSWTAWTALGADFTISFAADWTFRPPEVHIKVGDTVTWVNDSPDVPDLASGEGLWETVWLHPGETLVHTFTAAGTFYCWDLDANESCTVVVSPATAVTPPTPVLTTPTWTTDGRFGFIVTNLADGKKFVIQASTNLLSTDAADWVSVTNIASGTSYTFTEDAAAAGGARFYRVLALASQ
jgi:plastocyanin